jgi:ribonuclease HI
LVKIIHFDFEPQDLDEVIGSRPGRVNKVKVFGDGGSRGNPGPSASGFVILDMDNNVLVDKGVYIGMTTNNQAEYAALKLGLEEAKKMGAKEVEVYMDSMLVVNQLKGIFKVKNRELWALHDSITVLADSFERITFTHVPRELNKLADAAVNRALDEELGITRSKKLS